VDIQNHYYGHSAVFAAHVGLPRPRHIAGLVQHGWTATSPVAAHFADFPDVGKQPERRRLLVWSHRSRAWEPTAEARPTMAIGSPFLYLELLLTASGWARSDRIGPVFIPFHGTRLVRVRGAHKELAHQVAEVDGPSTVCLHSDDILDPDITDAWASAGHHLVTAGHRDDPEFLLRIMYLVGNASKVSSNRLSTALVYAAAIGSPSVVYGDPLTFGQERTTKVDELRQKWPEFYETTARAEVTTLARAELGDDALLTPEALRFELGWLRKSNVGPATDYWLSSPLSKAARVLGLAGRSEESRTAMSAGSSNPLLWLKDPRSHLPRRLPKGLAVPLELVLPHEVRTKHTSA
jgi:hypothetical protein